MKSIPLYSIVLPVHNTGNILKSTLNSILNQSLDNFELLIIDDHSNDITTLNILNELSDDRVSVIKNPLKGAAHAYNYGIDIAKSNFIAIADHDDLFDKTLFLKEYRILAENAEIGLVSASYSIIDENGYLISNRKVPTNHREIFESMLSHCSFMNSGSMIRREIFEKFGNFKQEYFPSQDYEFYLRIMKSVNFFNIAEFLIKWRNRKNSTSQLDYLIQNSKSRDLLINFIEENYSMPSNMGLKFFLLGRVIYNYETPFTAIHLFFKSIYFGHITKSSFFYLIKSFFSIPIMLYRKMLLIFIYKKKFQ